MAIKKLQNNFTTPEQSKRLLELGVPADSADCYYYEPLGGCNYVYALQNGSPLKETERRQRIIVHPDTKLYPCWSVGRLMEIFDTCKTWRTDCYRDWVEYTTCDDYVELIISAFDRWNSTLDFSKLEE